MTQEDKELLLKDLCARLPYGVVCQMEDTFIINESPYYDCILSERRIELFKNHKGFYIKPYLRPMSSMTEEEAKEVSILYLYGREDILSTKITDKYIEVVVDDCAYRTETRMIWYDEIISSIEIFDWLNAHHFDYRKLIEKGLAIEVTEKNNPYKD